MLLATTPGQASENRRRKTCADVRLALDFTALATLNLDSSNSASVIVHFEASRPVYLKTKT